MSLEELLSMWLHGLADRAVRIEDEGILHEAAELIFLADDRSIFDLPMEGDDVKTDLNRA